MVLLNAHIASTNVKADLLPLLLPQPFRHNTFHYTSSPPRTSHTCSSYWPHPQLYWSPGGSLRDHHRACQAVTAQANPTRKL